MKSRNKVVANALAARNSEYDDQIVAGYRQSFHSGLKKVAEGIAMLRNARNAGTSHHFELRKTDPSFCDTVENLINERDNVTIAISKSKR